jgi:hypothetical protein
MGSSVLSRPLPIIVVTLAMAAVPDVFGSEKIEAAPAESSSGSVTLSAADRLGIKFNPAPQDAPAESLPPARDPVSPDSVQPGVVVFAPFHVRERMRLNEKNTLSDKGRVEYAEKQYLSPLYQKTFGPLVQLATYYFNFLSILGGWHPNEAEAMSLYDQDERLERLTEMNDLIRLETIGNSWDAKKFEDLKAGIQLQSR